MLIKGLSLIGKPLCFIALPFTIINGFSDAEEKDRSVFAHIDFEPGSYSLVEGEYPCENGYVGWRSDNGSPEFVVGPNLIFSNIDEERQSRDCGKRCEHFIFTSSMPNTLYHSNQYRSFQESGPGPEIFEKRKVVTFETNSLVISLSSSGEKIRDGTTFAKEQQCRYEKD
ncbi:hypothetical protein PSH49_22205 [Pseudoalteromonas sp. GABNS16G]|jgi:hypothetical protein|uniref:hypothetical protein n=1 Tax=Pseudoalteromonas sp. GABNS16G TaxID=3025324 RepID=UPI000A9F6C48|nr:hypothetical protein [Pseudoalteromonas sp. GABNS16G]MDC9603292.1 hypothetical protein [Pseudoalteromonas sp. GABNS16G]|tara:strand:- start:7030 stop:7539 length:510 start_codon:yes stop_codon:yes gene_type:complete